MRAAPPAGRVGGIASMGGPAIGLIFLQAEITSHILGISHALEHAHVFAAGENISAVNAAVHFQHMPGRIGFFVQILLFHPPGFGLNEVPPDNGRVRNFPAPAHGHQAHGGNIKITLQVLLACFPAVLIVIEQVESVALGIFRINPVPGKPAAQAVASVMHGLHGADNGFATDFAALFMKHTGDGAAGRDPFLALYGAAPARPCCLSVSDFLHHCSLLHAKRRLLRPLQMRTERAEQTSLFAIFRIIRKETVHVKGETVLSMY